MVAKLRYYFWKNWLMYFIVRKVNQFTWFISKKQTEVTRETYIGHDGN